MILRTGHLSGHHDIRFNRENERDAAEVTKGMTKGAWLFCRTVSFAAVPEKVASHLGFQHPIFCFK